MPNPISAVRDAIARIADYEPARFWSGLFAIVWIALAVYSFVAGGWLPWLILGFSFGLWIVWAFIYGATQKGKGDDGDEQ